MTPVYNPPTLKQKMITTNFGWGALKIPFYVPSEVFPEGTPVKFGATPNSILKSQAGNGAVTIGLALQETYDDSAMGQLQGYHFANDTRQRLDGSPIGVLSGNGYAEIRNYLGVFQWASPVYIGPSGLLVTTGHSMAVSNNKLPIVCEGAADGSAGTNGDRPVRIRFDFGTSFVS